MSAPHTNAGYLEEVQAALSSLPSLLIEMDPADLFSPERGIYLHPLERGGEWQRPVRVRILDRSKHLNTAAPGRLRIHGA
jgi:hypothetical protein